MIKEINEDFQLKGGKRDDLDSIEFDFVEKMTYYQLKEDKQNCTLNRKT